MNFTNADAAAMLAEMLGPEAFAVALTFFLMGVGILSGLSRLYGWISGRPAKPLTRRYLARTAVYAGLTGLGCYLLVTFPDSASPKLVIVAGIAILVVWFRLTVVSVRLLALFRRQAILGSARLGAAVIPVQDKAAAAPAPGISVKDSPIRSIPSLGKQLEHGLSGGKLLQWAPVAAGMVVMVVSAALFKRTGLDAGPGLSGTAGVDLGSAIWQSPLIIFGALGLGAALLLLVSRFAARRNIAYQDDPWLRLERMAAAERAKR